ncbi:MAG: M48 family metallopeptidase [Pseudomonadota bacterium]|nr:M48 family metallopeptidase [Pseudomonadota bacterium]MEC9391963.1 M48 family metallopeptidase [Pseudomonadota bacterium]MED5437022.1 M48 family metallopeptidase [Pseudomonadota bacterium]
MATANFELQMKISFTIKIFLFTSVLILNSCGTPTTVIKRGQIEEIDKERIIMQGIALNTYYKRLERINNLAYPLLLESIDFCKNNIKYDLGIKTISLNQIDKRFQNAASDKLFITEEQKVLFVIKDSPGYIAGIRSGDIIKTLSSKSFKWVNDDIFLNNERKNYSKEKVEITIKRKNLIDANNTSTIDKILTFNIKPNAICGYGVFLVQDDSLNAYADGKNLYVTQGMLRFIDEDKELQFILAHELAHNTEGHISKRTNNSILGTILDIAAAGAGIDTRGSFGAIGAQMYSQDFEREADYVGLYILAKSKIESTNIENFWRKLAAESPGSTINYNSSHPTSPERWANIKETQKEIRYKEENGIDLKPERVKNN